MCILQSSSIYECNLCHPFVLEGQQGHKSSGKDNPCAKLKEFIIICWLVRGKLNCVIIHAWALFYIRMALPVNANHRCSCMSSMFRAWWHFCVPLRGFFNIEAIFYHDLFHRPQTSTARTVDVPIAQTSCFSLKSQVWTLLWLFFKACFK